MDWSWMLRCVDDQPLRRHPPGAEGGPGRVLPLRYDSLAEPSTVWFADRPLANCQLPIAMCAFFTLVYCDAVASSHQEQQRTHEHLHTSIENSWPIMFLHRNPTFCSCVAEEGPAPPIDSQGGLSCPPLVGEDLQRMPGMEGGALHPPSASSTAHRPASVLVRALSLPPLAVRGWSVSLPPEDSPWSRRAFPPFPHVLVALRSSISPFDRSGTSDPRTRRRFGSVPFKRFQSNPNRVGWW